jgi:hypothetical protein
VRELERGDEPDTETDIASTTCQIIVSTGKKGVAGAIELKGTSAGFVQV